MAKGMDGRAGGRGALLSHLPALKLIACMMLSPPSGGPAGAAARRWHWGRWQRQRHQSSGRTRRVSALRHLVS